MAITWRNVSGPTGAEELRALQGASSMIGNSLGGLQTALTNYQAEQGKQFQQRKDDNTLAFRQSLMDTYKTPEALQAAIADGSVSRLQAQFGNEINAKDVLGAGEARLTQLRQNDMAGRQYSNQVAQDTAAPILSEIKSAVLAGDSPRARQLMAAVDPRFQGDAAESILGGEKNLFGFQVAKNTEQRAGQSHELDLRKGEASIRASNASAAASGANTALNNFKLSELKSEKEGNDVVAKLANAYQVETAKQKSEIDKVAVANPSIFVTKNGRVDPTKMSPDQIAAADGLLKGQGLRGLDIYTSGDSEAHQQAVMALREAGASPRLIDKLSKQSALFSTTAPADIGNDAATRAKQLEDRALVEDKTIREEGGLPTYKSDLNMTVKNAIANIPDKTQAAEASKAISRYYSSDGAKDSNGQRVFLPAEEVSRIVGGMQKTFSMGGMVPFTNNWNEEMVKQLKNAEKKRADSLVKAAELVEKQKIRTKKD